MGNWRAQVPPPQVSVAHCRDCCACLLLSRLLLLQPAALLLPRWPLLLLLLLHSSGQLYGWCLACGRLLPLLLAAWGRVAFVGGPELEGGSRSPRMRRRVQ